MVSDFIPPVLLTMIPFKAGESDLSFILFLVQEFRGRVPLSPVQPDTIDITGKDMEITDPGHMSNLIASKARFHQDHRLK